MIRRLVKVAIVGEVVRRILKSHPSRRKPKGAKASRRRTARSRASR